MFKIAILQKRAINAQIAKGKVDDSIMRVLSKEIACELMEIIIKMIKVNPQISQRIWHRNWKIKE